MKDEHALAIPTAAQAETMMKKARAAHPAFAEWLARSKYDSKTKWPGGKAPEGAVAVKKRAR